MSGDLLFDIDEGVATITLNRPEAMNALSVEMRDALIASVDEIEHNSAIRSVVIRGSGGNFMAGGDVKYFAEQVGTKPPHERRRIMENRINVLNPTILRIRSIRKPFLASVEGAVAGGGISLMMACDLAVASTNSVFRFAYAAIGGSPDLGGSHSLPRLVGSRRALEFMLLGDKVDAEAAYRHNLVNFLVPPAELATATSELALRLARGPTVSYGAIKHLINTSDHNSLAEHLVDEARHFGLCASTADWVEGTSAFVERRRPAFAGR